MNCVGNSESILVNSILKLESKLSSKFALVKSRTKIHKLFNYYIIIILLYNYYNKKLLLSSSLKLEILLVLKKSWSQNISGAKMKCIYCVVLII